MMRAANWATFDDDGRLNLTTRGRQILECADVVSALRMQIMDFVVNVKPPWSGLIARGRLETLRFVDADTRQCLQEAYVSEGYAADVVDFWDRAANLSRGRISDILLDIGRAGERLSIDYETRRTGREPIWKAIDSNLVGYDLLSVCSAEDDRPLKIEVKAVKRTDDRAIFLSKREWDCARDYGQYILHLWLLGDKPELVLKTPEEIERHVPVDHGQGAWQSVRITVEEEFRASSGPAN